MIAETQYRPDRYDLALAAIHALLNELDLGRYALFHEVGEGKIFPDGSESMSGGVVTEHGKIFTFWTDWDAAHGRPVFTTWKQIEPEPALAADQEYREARTEVGLPNIPIGLLRPPGQRYVTWKDQDGIDRMLPEHTLKQMGEVLAMVFTAGAALLNQAADRLRGRRA